MKTQVPQLVKWCMKNVLWRGNSKEKNVYLTFDDGPIPEVTPKVLDILDEYKVKATFFCVGHNVAKNPATYKEVINRGHKVGNHTFNHIKGFSNSTDEYVDNTQKAAELIQSNLFRPPHGQITRSQIKHLSKKYNIVMWDFITYDFDSGFDCEQIMQLIRKKTRNGSIVVFHDSLKAEKNVLEVLPRALQYWCEKGYKFKVIEDTLF